MQNLTSLVTLVDMSSVEKEEMSHVQDAVTDEQLDWSYSFHVRTVHVGGVFHQLQYHVFLRVQWV